MVRVEVKEIRRLYSVTVDPSREDEFLREPGVLRCYDVGGRARSIDLPEGSLAFTFCQVPVVYERVDGDARVRAELSDGRSVEFPGDRLDGETSRAVFDRRGLVACIRVAVPSRVLCRV